MHLWANSKPNYSIRPCVLSCLRVRSMTSWRQILFALSLRELCYPCRAIEEERILICELAYCTNDSDAAQHAWHCGLEQDAQ